MHYLTKIQDKILGGIKELFTSTQHFQIHSHNIRNKFDLHMLRFSKSLCVHALYLVLPGLVT